GARDHRSVLPGVGRDAADGNGGRRDSAGGEAQGAGGEDQRGGGHCWASQQWHTREQIEQGDVAMNALVDSAWALFVDASLKAALVGACAWGLLAVWRPKNASVRHGVWMAALAAMLLLPGLRHVAPRVSAPAGWYPSLAQQTAPAGQHANDGFIARP